MTVFFLKGIAFGFVLAATVGPMWVLCLRRTLAAGAMVGFASGMGIAVADALYGAVAAFGLAAASSFLLGQGYWIGLVGSAFLLWLGAKTLIAKPVPIDAGKEPAETSARHLSAAFFSTLGLTLANPPTILAFAAIFAGLGLAANDDYAIAAAVVAGVFFGSAGWWVILAAGAGRLRTRLGPDWMHAINIVSGLAILGFAAWQLAQLL